ncbi:MAG TPA: hypothetical protein VL221_02565 [Bacteroidota bacterium]|nr:hypothetical protein [Bacteroidota bacterium]
MSATPSRLATILTLILIATTCRAVSQDEKTTLGGYGNAVYTRQMESGDASVDLERVVLFIGHTFSRKVSLVSELEMEDAKVTGGEGGGEIAFEQAYIQFTLDAAHRVVAGLFLPRIGILNENHLPASFNGNERTQVETYIIPSTWRELGAGFYGENDVLPVEYSIALVNGLDASAFAHGSVIREGRFEGRNASAEALALTASIAKSSGNARIQVSGYYGGAAGLPPAEVDTLPIHGGAFGTPVALAEADAQITAGRFSLRLLGTLVSIPDAGSINDAFHNNTPRSARGGYFEAAYNLIFPSDAPDANVETANTGNAYAATAKGATAFIRYERLDMNASLPANGVRDGTLDQHHLVAGASYSPLRDIVIKADVRFQWTGAPPGGSGGEQETTFLTLGIGFEY